MHDMICFDVMRCPNSHIFLSVLNNMVAVTEEVANKAPFNALLANFVPTQVSYSTQKMLQVS